MHLNLKCTKALKINFKLNLNESVPVRRAYLGGEVPRQGRDSEPRQDRCQSEPSWFGDRFEPEKIKLKMII